MLNGYRDAARYLAAWLDARLRAARGNDAESGALSLEWIIIAAGLALVAIAAVTIFVTIVTNDANKLPTGVPGG